MQFSAVIGQQALKKVLVENALNGRIPHARLFMGPEGSGNLAIALAYATYLICEKRTATDSCGACPSCFKMAKMVHPDVSFSFPVAGSEKNKPYISQDFLSEFRESVIANPYLGYNDWVEFLEIENKQGIIAVDEAKDIVRRLSLKSIEAPYKIVIIWLAECLNNQAANKLLKILEEPPDHTLFFLVTEAADQLLATITSRTQLVKVNRIPEAELIPELAERHQLDTTKAKSLCHRSDSNYNEILKILREDEEADDYNKWFLEWMRSCYQLNIGAIGALSESFAKESREKQKGYLQHALHLSRECLLINYGDPSMVHLEGSELEGFKKFAPFINKDTAGTFVAEIDKAHYHLERNANSKILFTDLSFSLHGILRGKFVPN